MYAEETCWTGMIFEQLRGDQPSPASDTVQVLGWAREDRSTFGRGEPEKGHQLGLEAALTDMSNDGLPGVESEVFGGLLRHVSTFPKNA